MKTKIKKFAVLLLMMSVFTMTFGETATPAFAEGINLGDVVINEIMWMGSSISSSDEWIELRNMTDNEIDFSATSWSIYKNDSLMLVIDDGILEANGYFLISNNSEDHTFTGGKSALNITPDFIDSSVSLSGSAIQYKLYDAKNSEGSVIDTADDGTGAPLAGDNGDIKKSMSRKSTPGDGTLEENWCTASTSVNWDAGATELGTPRAANDCSGVTPPDATPPIRDNGLPTGELATGTTETTLSLTTDENANCKYSTTAGTEYDAMIGIFDITGETEHSTSITGLENGQSYVYYVRCQDELENTNIDDYEISFSVANEISDALFVTESYPADDSTDVSISVKPYLEFSKPLKVDTIIGADNIQLRKYAKLAADSTQIEVNLSIENNDKKVVFNLVENLEYETQYYFYVGAGVKDADGNPIESENKWLHGDRASHEFTTEISGVTPPDATPPIRDNGLPTGELATGTTETTLSLTTDENATCKYSTASEISYADMTESLSADEVGLSYTTLITGLTNGNDYVYYVRCQDTSENTNANTDDYEISFSVASPQLSGGSGGFTPSSVSSSNKPLTVLSFQKGELTQRLNGENKVKVEIPKGSVKSKTTFTASKGSLADGGAPKNKVGAFLFNGLVFNIEAVDLRGNVVRDFSEDLTITLTVPDLPDDTSNLKLYYYDDENQEWIIISDVEFGDNTITFKVNHLTQFAVFEIPKPVVKGASDVVLFDGDIIRNPGAQGMAQFDVYVVKIINGKKFKRLILNPDIFESYEHLDWENVKLVDQTVMDSFTLSNLARCGNTSIEVGVQDFEPTKIYRLIPKDDAGTKQHFNITAFEFETKGYDWNSVYIINSVDMNVYIPGPDII